MFYFQNELQKTRFEYVSSYISQQNLNHVNSLKIWFRRTFFYLELNSQNLVPLYFTEMKIGSRSQWMFKKIKLGFYNNWSNLYHSFSLPVFISGIVNGSFPSKKAYLQQLLNTYLLWDSKFLSYEIELRKMTSHFELLIRSQKIYRQTFFFTFKLQAQSWKIKSYTLSY